MVRNTVKIANSVFRANAFDFLFGTTTDAVVTFAACVLDFVDAPVTGKVQLIATSCIVTMKLIEQNCPFPTRSATASASPIATRSASREHMRTGAVVGTETVIVIAIAGLILGGAIASIAVWCLLTRRSPRKDELTIGPEELEIEPYSVQMPRPAG
jgi:hypothetical protein